MELGILRGSTKLKLPKLRELGDLDEVSKKGGNQETQSTAARHKKKRWDVRRCERIGRWKIERERERESEKSEFPNYKSSEKAGREIHKDI